MAPEILFTGFASITASGPARGLPALTSRGDPQPITRWPTPGPRHAFVVPAFRATDFVPYLRTRRMDRLSAWALLGSALAVQDAGIGPEVLAGERTAVVYGTAYGCLDLTAEFLAAVATNASQAPPILFPETLSNLPGSHIARHFGITGPNLTMSAGLASGGAALQQAVGLLQAGDAERAIVLGGDTLTPALFAWYEAAGMLNPACLGRAFSAERDRCGIIPGEGLAACLIETRSAASARQARAYGRYHFGWLGSPLEGTTEHHFEGLPWELLDDGDPARVAVVASRGSWRPRLASVSPPGVADLQLVPGRDFGDFGGSGLLQVGIALARLPEAEHGLVLVAGPPDGRPQCAAVVVGRPERP